MRVWSRRAVSDKNCFQTTVTNLAKKYQRIICEKVRKNIISASRDRKDDDDVVMMMMARDLDGALRHLSNVSSSEKVKKGLSVFGCHQSIVQQRSSP